MEEEGSDMYGGGGENGTNKRGGCGTNERGREWHNWRIDSRSVYILWYFACVYLFALFDCLANLFTLVGVAVEVIPCCLSS